MAQFPYVPWRFSSIWSRVWLAYIWWHYPLRECSWSERGGTSHGTWLISMDSQALLNNESFSNSKTSVLKYLWSQKINFKNFVNIHRVQVTRIAWATQPIFKSNFQTTYIIWIIKDIKAALVYQSNSDYFESWTKISFAFNFETKMSFFL